MMPMPCSCLARQAGRIVPESARFSVVETPIWSHSEATVSVSLATSGIVDVALYAFSVTLRSGNPAVARSSLAASGSYGSGSAVSSYPSITLGIGLLATSA